MLRHREETPEEGRQAPGSDAGSLSLSREELSEVLNAAIARQEQTVPAYGDLATLEEALEIARQANIPEEYVLAAAEELRLRKARTEEERQRALLRADRRRVVRTGRKRLFWSWTALAAVLAVAAGFNPWALGGILLPITFVLGVRWLFWPVPDEEADRVELAPVAGVCRVCGQPAYGPRATFCEEHRFRPPR